MKKLLIVLAGVDGVGKTTHSFLLYKFMSRMGFSTSLVHDEFPSLIRLVMQRWGSSREIAIMMREQKVINEILRGILHVFLYAFNEILLLIRILRALKNCDVTILDRWFPDSLASITYSRKSYMWLIMKILNILSRSIGIIVDIQHTQVLIILLKVDPTVAHLRRPEHSLIRQKVVSTFTEYFCRIVAKENSWILNIIDTTNKSVQETHLMVLKTLLKTINLSRL
jgi:thymidylate kinase